MNIAANMLVTAVPFVALGIPFLFTLGALATGRFNFVRADAAWRWAIRAGGLCVAAAVFVAVGVNHVPTVVSPVSFVSTSGAAVLTLRMDVLTAVLLPLVAFLGWVVLRFSRNYLNGDAGQLRYLRWLQLTLAAVTLLVQSNNLLVLALAWLVTSLALHQLLTYYSNRPQALVAAHKKFLLSRVADISLFTAVLLVGNSHGTLELDQVFAAHNPTQPLSLAMHVAMTLLAFTAILKCAQLPFHGWLIQVMEAPTPVSALLHAGVVNLGGFVLIRLSPLLSHAKFAQNLLLVVGALTATGAAMVMMTRISVKVMLAWSTCAQMGLMLLQCSLGAYSLALLHLVAHSLYKAHAFLSSGNTVAIRRELALAPRVSHVGFGAWMLAAIASVSVVTLSAKLVGINLQSDSSWWLPVGLVALSLPALVIKQLTVTTAKVTVYVLVMAASVPALYYLWHGVFASILPPPSAEPTRELGSLFALAAFAILYVVHAWVSSNPSAPSTQWLFRYAFNGFYLDELFTRLTFRIWPPKITSLESQKNVKPKIALAV